LLDFIAMAHGLKYNTAGQPVYNLKASYLSRKGRLVPVDFSALLADGDMSQNILLESGDFIYIASSQARSAFVVGAVKMPQKVRFDVDITLLDAIASAGGLASGAKNTIYVVRDSLVHPEVLKVNYKNILKGKEKNIYLKPGDIVYVPRGFLSKISDLPNKILPFLNLIIQSDAAYNVLR
jgi:polysaccharide export outer membrane protein